MSVRKRLISPVYSAKLTQHLSSGLRCLAALLPAVVVPHAEESALAVVVAVAALALLLAPDGQAGTVRWDDEEKRRNKNRLTLDTMIREEKRETEVQAKKITSLCLSTRRATATTTTTPYDLTASPQVKRETQGNVAASMTDWRWLEKKVPSSLPPIEIDFPGNSMHALEKKMHHVALLWSAGRDIQY